VQLCLDLKQVRSSLRKLGLLKVYLGMNKVFGRQADRQRFRVTSCVSAAFAMGLFSSCHRTSAPRSRDALALDIRQSIEPMPVRVGKSELTVQVLRLDGSPLRGAHISVEADMSHPGMAPVFSGAEELGDGRYRADLKLDMAGDWVVLLHLHTPEGESVERQIELKGVQAR